MYTRCPACHAVHAVNAALLAASAGDYRCARCNKVSNALENLFDELPEAGDRPPGPGSLPVLGLSIDLAAAARARTELPGSDGADAAPEDARRISGGRPLVRAALILAAVVIIGFSAIRLAEFGGLPLLDSGNSGLSPGESEAGPFPDPDRIELVSRELRSHPAQPGRLRLSAIIVNRSDRGQRFPSIEVALHDAAGNTLGIHRFEPSGYLDAGRAQETMPPGIYVPFMVDLDDPGEQAVGFELSFR